MTDLLVPLEEEELCLLPRESVREKTWGLLRGCSGGQVIFDVELGLRGPDLVMRSDWSDLV